MSSPVLILRNVLCYQRAMSATATGDASGLALQFGEAALVILSGNKQQFAVFNARRFELQKIHALHKFKSPNLGISGVESRSCHRRRTSARIAARFSSIFAMRAQCAPVCS